MKHVAPLGWEHLSFTGDYAWETGDLPGDPANSGRSGPSRRCWQREPRSRRFRLGVHSGHFLAVTPWLGSAKLVGFKNAEPDEHGNEVWAVYAVTPQPREGRS